MKVVLEVEKGKNQGTRYEITSRCYRSIGRATPVGEHTMDFALPGEHALDPDDLARVEQHLAGRPSAPQIGDDRLRIGNYARGRDITLDDNKVSKTHAMLFVDDDGASIVDLLSTNGTHVNGKKIADSDLREGDVINIGKTRFTVYLSA